MDSMQPVGGSLPQGSPISPILFMLFMAPLYDDMYAEIRGYADDGNLIAVSDHVSQNSAKLEWGLQRIKRWCVENGLSLDLAKTGLLHITRKRHKLNPPLTMPDGSVIQPTDPKGSLRWLGVQWTRRLCFNEHVRTVAARAETTIRGLRVLAGCYKGAPIKSVLMAVRACVLPILTFASTTWWPTRPLVGADKRMPSSIALLDKTLRRALRAALPLYRTTPVDQFNRASGFPPMKLILDDLARKEAMRISASDKLHPLRVHAMLGGKISRLLALLPHGLDAPIAKIYVGPYPARSQQDRGYKDEASNKHLQILEARQSDLWIYTDGSRISDGKVGAGWVLIHEGHILCSGSQHAKAHAEVPDAEALAVSEAIKALDRLRPKPPVDRIWICLDNKGIVSRLTNPGAKRGSSQHLIDRSLCTIFRLSRQRWPGRTQAPDFVVAWVPGHANIPGNEAADGLAKQAAREAPPSHARVKMSLSWARKWSREQLNAEFAEWWRSSPSAKRPHLAQPLSPPTKAWKSLLGDTERNAARATLTAMTNHGDFAAYHRRFGHDNARLACPLCEQETSPDHVWTCRKNPQQISCRFFQKLIVSQKGARWLASKLAKAPRCLIGHRLGLRERTSPPTP